MFEKINISLNLAVLWFGIIVGKSLFTHQRRDRKLQLLNLFYCLLQSIQSTRRNGKCLNNPLFEDKLKKNSKVKF